MKEIARFYDVEEAQIAKSFLIAQGLDVRLADEGALGVMPEMRVGLGGYRLVGEERDAAIATRLLADIEHDHSAAKRCPACGAAQLQRTRNRLFPFFFVLFGWLFPFAPAGDTLRCRACGHTEPDAESRDEEETAP